MSQFSPETTSALSAKSVAIPHQQTHGDSVFPYVFRCETNNAACQDAVDWVSGNRETLLELAKQHGAVLLRDFPLRSVDDFDAIIQALAIPNFPYRKSLSNAVRVNRTERVFSANEAPPEVKILFHHEMAQTPVYPHHILFYCEVAAEEGGATPICRSDILYQRLAAEVPGFVNACENKGLKYTHVMPDQDDAASGQGRSWQATFQASTRDEAEQRLRELNYDWEWMPNGCLRCTTPPLPAVMEFAPGRKSFFNQLIAAHCGWKQDPRNASFDPVRYGDDSPLDADGVAVAVRLADELTFDVDWQQGDAVLIDNTLVMHARRPFRGTRKIVASLANMRTVSFEPSATENRT